MHINGFLKTTLLDYPGQVACTVFCGSCNFRCPFCHNGDLVLTPQSMPLIAEDTIFAHLRKRQGILDGVCVTGGEPTLQPDLPDFLRKVKKLGFQVKLDTNGYRPEILRSLCEEGLVDYVAMDVKQAPDKYNSICQVSDFSLTRIQESIDYLISGSIPYEFRTTIVRELHTIEDMRAIAHWIRLASSYYLQSYKDSDQVMVPGFSAYTPAELDQILSEVQKELPQASLRGIDD